MGQSTDGQICFGVLFEDGFEFPWSECGDEEKWWRKANGYKPPFELYDADGEYLNGVKPTEEKIREWYDHRRAWDAQNPLPVTLVNYCSGDCPMYILAAPSTLRTARRGYPKKMDSRRTRGERGAN